MSKKIMFNDKYGLTEAVLAGKKTMTRRMKDNFKVGEVVAIAMSYNDVFNSGYPVDSRFDAFRTAYAVGDVKITDKGWTNKMFVKANLMPYLLKITKMKMEYLQDISDEDCLKEGVIKHHQGSDEYSVFSFKNTPVSFGTAQAAFAALIDKVSGKGTWAANPWVFAYEFELVR